MYNPVTASSLPVVAKTRGSARVGLWNDFFFEFVLSELTARKKIEVKKESGVLFLLVSLVTLNCF